MPSFAMAIGTVIIILMKIQSYAKVMAASDYPFLFLQTFVTNILCFPYAACLPMQATRCCHNENIYALVKFERY